MFHNIKINFYDSSYMYYCTFSCQYFKKIYNISLLSLQDLYMYLYIWTSRVNSHVFDWVVFL